MLLTSINKKIHKSSSRGFTMVEMLIIAPIIILTIGIFIGTIITMTSDVLASRANNSLVHDVQAALDKIEEDVKFSGGYLSVNNINIMTPQGYDDDTGVFVNSAASRSNMLILNSRATTNNPLSGQRNILYTTTAANPCDQSKANQNPPVMINIVYFVKDNTLWRRTITPEHAIIAYDGAHDSEIQGHLMGCDTTANGNTGASTLPWQLPSCTPGFEPSASFCKTEDIKLLEGVSNTDGFITKYFTNASETVEEVDATNPAKTDEERQSALRATNTVGVTINAIIKAAGKDISQSGTIRVISQNDNISKNE